MRRKASRDSPNSVITARGRPVSTHLIRILVALVLRGIAASCVVAAIRTKRGSRVDIEIALSASLRVSASANIFRRAMSIATFPIALVSRKPFARA